jgi:hypothetical protein
MTIFTWQSAIPSSIWCRKDLISLRSIRASPRLRRYFLRSLGKYSKMR